MQTHVLAAILVSVLFGQIVSSAVAADAPRQTARSSIREFEPEVVARLGRAIYEHDKLAWIATDVLLAKRTEAQLQSEGLGGWVVDAAPQAAIVRFVRKQGDSVEAGYDIVFRKGEKPELMTPENRTLTESQVAQWRAAQTAREAVFGARRPWCGGNPNSVVLKDPEHRGLLVYILRPKPAAKKVPIGGHYRVSVTEDGRKAVQVDQLFASCLTLDREDVAGNSVVALVASHIVSSRPLETHVFLSLQEKVPFNIVAPSGIIWEIKDGALKQVGPVGAAE